jgi:hypothetical protein
MDGLALYGAVVGTAAILLSAAALGWQVYSWRRDRSTSVEVKLSNGFLTFGPRLEAAVMITAVNHSRHPVKINPAGLKRQDRSELWAIKTVVPSGAGLPGVVAPGDSADTWWFLGEIGGAGLDLYKPLIARVTTGTGSFESKPTTLRER